jgi:nucleotide-binding universal stress UspA family protein
MRFEPILKKILFPTDGAAGSEDAQRLVAMVAKVFKSRVTVLHAISQELTSLEYEYAGLITAGSGIPLGRLGQSSEPPPSDLIKLYNEMEDSLYRKGEEILEKTMSFFKQEGVDADKRLVAHIDPAASIVKQAQEGSYDLVIMGRREDESDEQHLGSTAEKVARHSEIPVLIVGSFQKISKVLIAFDGSQSAERALQYAAHLAKNVGANMTILYVQPSELLRAKPDRVREVENRILSRASQILEETELDRRAESGDPAKVIVQTAKAGKYDLIVMGRRGHSVIERFLLGSVSEHVVHYADTSVLLVK